MARRTQAELRSVLSQWDRGDLAPLTVDQKVSCTDLATRAGERPLPDLPLGNPDAVFDKKDAQQVNDTDMQATDAVSLEKIETSQQFFKWFGAIESQMEREQESTFTQYHELLNKYSSRCDEVLSEIDNATTYLQNIETQYLSASTKTNALHKACEKLVQEQTDLITFNENINERLGYFVELDGLTAKMNSPTLSVLNDKFIPMLGRIDECITYVQQHPQYHESKIYLARFKQCQNRAMSLVKIHVVNTLKAATKNVLAQTQTQTPKQGSSSNNSGSEQSFTLFYGKFRMHAPRIKMLMQEIERRAEHNSDFAALLQDCYSCYFEQRTALLSPTVTKSIDDLVSAHGGDLAAFVRAGCAHMVRVCCSEHQLYQHFFHSVDSGLDDFLEGLATILYDICRPLFIAHSANIDTLVELCNDLQVEAMDNKGAEVAAFASVAEQMLQDVQQRLCYRTQAYVSSDIAGFIPKMHDIDYPNKLIALPTPATSPSRPTKDIRSNTKNNNDNNSNTNNKSNNNTNNKNNSNNNNNTKNNNKNNNTNKNNDNNKNGNGNTAKEIAKENAKEEEESSLINPVWYPTVSRTLVLLSKLYRSVQKSVFQTLSQELLDACLQTLMSTQRLVTAKSGKMAGRLFVIMHLLVLREQIVPFDVSFTKTEKYLDFGGFLSSIKGAAGDFITTSKSKGIFSDPASTVMAFLDRTTPKMMEQRDDAREELTAMLKKACLEFMTENSRIMTVPLNSFIVKVEVLSDDKRKTLSTLSFATPEKVHEAVVESMNLIRTTFATIVKETSLFLDIDTVKILLAQIQVNVVETFTKFHNIVQKHYITQEDMDIIALPSIEQLKLNLHS